MNLLLRTISRLTFLTPKPNHHIHFSALSTACEAATPDQLLDIITTSNPMEPALEKVVPVLHSTLVHSVLQGIKNPQLGFRFFVWAAKRRTFRMWVSFDFIVGMLVEENGFELYWKTLEQLKGCGISIPSDAFTVLIAGYWKVRMAEKAVEAFGRMYKDFDCIPGLYACNLVLLVTIKKEVILLALAIYSLMLKWNCAPNVGTYTILIDGLCKSGKTQDALQLFDEMFVRGVRPNRVTYTAIISGLCQAKRADEAGELLNTMICRGSSPDQITFHALLNGFCKLGKLDEAFMLSRFLKKEGYGLGLKEYSSLIDGLFRARRFNEAHELFQKMSEENVAPDLILYTIMIRGLTDADRFKDAMELFRIMTERGVTPDTYCYNALIKGFCDMGLLAEARSLKLEISNHDCFPDTFTHTILICGMCTKGLVGEAIEIFNEMEKVGCVPSVVTFNALIDGLCKVGKLEEAHHLFYKMEVGRKPSLFLRLSQGENQVHDSASLQIMVERLCDSGAVLKAYELLMQIADSGVLPDIMTYNILINGFSKAGNMDGASKVFKELQLKGHQPDSVTYGTLIDGLQRVGREEDAFWVLEQMMKKGCTPSSAVYRSLMTWSCRRKNVPVAFSIWMKYLRSLPGQKEEAIKAAEEHFEREELDKAFRGLLECESKFVDFDSAPYSILLIGLCQANKLDEALKVFSILVESGINVTAPSCAKLIQSHCREYSLDQAINIFCYTMEKGFLMKKRICNELLRCLLTHGKPYDAIDLLEKMNDVGYDLDAYLFRSTKDAFVGLFEQMMMKGCTPCSAVYKSLMAWSCPRKKVSVACSIWMKHLRSLPGRLEEAIKEVEEYFERGEMDKAIRGLLECESKLNDFDLVPYYILLNGLRKAGKSDEALKVFFILVEWGINVSAPSCMKLIRSLCVEQNFDQAINVFFYTMEKGFMMRMHLCDELLRCLLTQGKPSDAVDLLKKMNCEGYNLDAHISDNTKVLLQSHLSTNEVENGSLK